MFSDSIQGASTHLPVFSSGGLRHGARAKEYLYPVLPGSSRVGGLHEKEGMNRKASMAWGNPGIRHRRKTDLGQTVEEIT